MAALQIPQFYVTEFAKNWEYLVQQSDSRLNGAVTATSFMGRRKWFNQLSLGVMTEVVDRKGDTPDGDSTGLKYWIYRRKFEFVKVWDEDDQLNLDDIALPTSDEVMSFGMAENRTKDDVIIQAMGATRFIGENGTDTDVFPSGQQIAVNYVYNSTTANSGLTLPKLREANRILNINEVPNSDRFIAVGARQLDDLLATVEVTSRDYSDIMALKDGKIDNFMGFKFINSQRLPYVSSTDIRTIYAWHKGGIKFAENGRNVYIDPLPGRRHATQLRGVSRMGAVRTENERVVSIACDQSP
jgi:hypothetical protein